MEYGTSIVHVNQFLVGANRALNNYFAKDLKASEPKRTNQKPENELTKKPCMKWFKDNGWSMNSVESKAVFNVAMGKYQHGQTASGVSDAFGCTPNGIGAFVEFKAPGRRGTLKPHQRAFLEQKIKCGAFAVCVDSLECLRSIWIEFEAIRGKSDEGAKSLLLDHLPSIMRSDRDLKF